MTVALSIKVFDGLVLATDSAATMVAQKPGGPEFVANVYNNANKLFNLHRGLPIAGMTWGHGSIGRASIATLAKDLRKRFEGRDDAHPEWAIDPSDYSIEDVAAQVWQFLYKEYYQVQYRREKDPAKKPSFGFMVGGYSPGSDLAEEWLIGVDGGVCPKPNQVRSLDECGWIAFASQEPILRLLLGYSPGLKDVLKDKLGVPEADVEAAMGIIESALAVPVVVPPMPIQDAIDLADFLVQLTSMYHRFCMGPQIVGGPTEIAALTKHEGFKWIKRKYYYSRHLNPLRKELADEEDYVRQRSDAKGQTRGRARARAQSHKRP